jgi:hypothetical protein
MVLLYFQVRNNQWLAVVFNLRNQELKWNSGIFRDRISPYDRFRVRKEITSPTKNKGLVQMLAAPNGCHPDNLNDPLE